MTQFLLILQFSFPPFFERGLCVKIDTFSEWNTFTQSYFHCLLEQEISELSKKNSNRISESSSKSMEDILEENAALKNQNKWLIDVIAKNITELSNRIQKNTEEVSSNSNLIQKNMDDIEFVSEEVSSFR